MILPYTPEAFVSTARAAGFEVNQHYVVSDAGVRGWCRVTPYTLAALEWCLLLVAGNGHEQVIDLAGFVIGSWLAPVPRPAGTNRLAVWYSQAVDGSSGLTFQWWSLRADLTAREAGPLSTAGQTSAVASPLAGGPGCDQLYAAFGVVGDGAGSVGGWGAPQLRLDAPPRHGVQLMVSALSGGMQPGARLRFQWWR